jgi:hypothetical protein
MKYCFIIAEYMCHIYVRADGLCCVLTADHEYPQRVAHTLLTKVSAPYIFVEFKFK